MKSIFGVLLLLVVLENKSANGGLIKKERKTTPQAPYISDSPIVEVPMLKVHYLCAKDQGCDRAPGNVVCLGHRGEKYLRVAQSLCHFKAYLRCNRMDAEREREFIILLPFHLFVKAHDILLHSIHVASQ